MTKGAFTLQEINEYIIPALPSPEVDIVEKVKELNKLSIFLEEQGYRQKTDLSEKDNVSYWEYCEDNNCIHSLAIKRFEVDDEPKDVFSIVYRCPSEIWDNLYEEIEKMWIYDGEFKVKEADYNKVYHSPNFKYGLIKIVFKWLVIKNNFKLCDKIHFVNYGTV